MPSSAAATRHAVDRRRHHRVASRLDALLVGGGATVPCVIVEVSSGGAAVLAQLPPLLAAVRLEIEAFGAFACRVAWSDSARVGLEFIDDPQTTARRLGDLIRGA